MSNCKGSAGFNLDGAIRGVARNNIIFNAAKAGITLFQIDGAEASHDNLIVNNTVYDPTGSRAAIQVADGANNNVIFNNIFVSQAAAFEVQTVTGLMHDYNLVSSYTGTTASAHEATPANFAALFVDAVGVDLLHHKGELGARDLRLADACAHVHLRGCVERGRDARQHGPGLAATSTCSGRWTIHASPGPLRTRSACSSTTSAWIRPSSSTKCSRSRA